MRKKIEEMNKEELVEELKNIENKITRYKTDIQKYTKLVSALKEKIKNLNKDIELCNCCLKILDLKEKIEQNNKVSKEIMEENTTLKDITEISEENVEKIEVIDKSYTLYLFFKKITEKKYVVYSVSENNELIELIYKYPVSINYDNISVPISELYCFIEWLKYIIFLQNRKELISFKISKIYIDNLYIVKNWTNGIVKENQNEILKELIPIVTDLRKKFENFGGELIYIKPKENIARIYYNENIAED